MFSLLCLAILIYAIKGGRLRVHVSLAPAGSRRKARTDGELRRKRAQLAPGAMTRPLRVTPAASKTIKVRGIAGRAPGSEDPAAIRVYEIASGLVNLDAPARRSQEAAERAVREHPGATFDVQFSVALQQVRSAA